MNKNRPILVIEDDYVDALTVKRALSDNAIFNEVIFKSNGEDALAYLQDQSAELPAIILLDLNMPRMNGIEFLQLIKQDKRLLAIPVIVLTTSRSEQDKLDSFQLGVAGYMIKSVNYPDFVEMIRKLKDYWDVSELPI